MVCAHTATLELRELLINPSRGDALPVDRSEFLEFGRKTRRDFIGENRDDLAAPHRVAITKLPAGQQSPNKH